MASPFIKRYLVALDRHKWAGLAGFLVVMGLSGVAAMQPAPPSSYVAKGTLSYVAPPLTFSQTGSALQQQGQAVTEEMMLSDYVVDTVVKQLQAQQIQTSTEELRDNTSVSIRTPRNDDRENEERSRGFIIRVNYQDANRDRAQLTLQLLMNAIVAQSRLFNTQQLKSIVDNLNTLLPKVSRELRAAEQDLERYIRQEGPAIQAAQDGDILAAITGSQAQQRQLRLALSGLDAQIQSLQTRLGLSPDQAYTSSALSADPLIADLRAKIYQAETQISLLSNTLRSEHPTMVELQNQQQVFEQLLQQRVNEVIGENVASATVRRDSSLDPARQQLANTLVNLQTQRETLQQQLTALSQAEQELRQQYANLPNKQLQQTRLQQQVALKQAFYDQIQARLADVTIAENEVAGSLVVVQPPQTQLSGDARPAPVVVLIVGGIVGLLVGGGLVLLLDSLDATFHTLQDLQAALRQQEVPVLGLLPLLPEPDEDELLPVIAEHDSPFTDPYERLRSTLRRAAGGQPIKMVLLTSTVSGEGKTVTAYNLAIASAYAGKRTLLVEADLRSPSHARTLKVTPAPESYIEPLRYYGHLSECITLVPEIENLYIIPSPGPQRQASAILESSEMRQMLEDVKGRFDLIILDTPSLSRASDALLLEPYTDGLILVTRPGFTEEGLLAEAIEQFNESEDLQFLGSVINGADLPVQPKDLSDDRDDHFLIEDLETIAEPDRVGVRFRNV